MFQKLLGLLGLAKEERKGASWREPQGELRIRPMTFDDLDAVAQIERMCFGWGAWSKGALASALKRVQDSCFMVATVGDVVVGFAGWRRELNEAHVANIAVHPQMQGRKIGELLLRAILEEAVRRGINISLLEVRKSNTVAQNLYRKYGYEVIGVRRGYYQFPLEDGLVMKLTDIRSALQRVPPPKVSVAKP